MRIGFGVWNVIFRGFYFTVCFNGMDWMMDVLKNKRLA